MTTTPTGAGPGFDAWAAELRAEIVDRYGIQVDTGTDEFREVYAERFSVDEMLEAIETQVAARKFMEELTHG
jgi:hypothetical protein